MTRSRALLLSIVCVTAGAAVSAAAASTLTEREYRALVNAASRELGGSRFACLRPVDDEYGDLAAVRLAITSRRALPQARAFKRRHRQVTRIEVVPERFAHRTMSGIYRAVLTAIRPFREDSATWSALARSWPEGRCAPVVIQAPESGPALGRARGLQQTFGADRVFVALELLPTVTKVG